jgi:hypothetical protein
VVLVRQRRAVAIEPPERDMIRMPQITAEMQ